MAECALFDGALPTKLHLIAADADFRARRVNGRTISLFSGQGLRPCTQRRVDEIGKVLEFPERPECRWVCTAPSHQVAPPPNCDSETPVEPAVEPDGRRAPVMSVVQLVTPVHALIERLLECARADVAIVVCELRYIDLHRNPGGIPRDLDACR